MKTDQEKRRAAYERGLALGKTLSQGKPPLQNHGAQYWHDAARTLAQTIGWETETVIQKVEALHRERLDAVPDLTTYPELRGYRDRLAEYERGMQDGGLDEPTIALYQSLNFWRDTRLQQEIGRAVFVLPQPEKCRILYVPDSDEGALHLKNVDDPITYWTPAPPFEPNAPWPWKHPLVFDGVGSGLHIDETSPEIFPVEVHELCREHCTMVEAATEFLVRYNYFWAGQNLIVHDHHGNSMAFEKTACRVATRGPNAQGINFITGMGALDPGIRDFQKQQRQKYLDQTNQSWDDSPEGCFFTQSENTWSNMEKYVEEVSLNPSFDNAKQLMEQRDPSGPMCLTGQKVHPDQTTTGYTLAMLIFLMDQKKQHRRQWRGNVPSFLDTPEVAQFV